MKVVKRGKDLAIRIPAALVRQLKLRQGDEIDLRRMEDGRIGVSVVCRVGDVDDLVEATSTS